MEPGQYPAIGKGTEKEEESSKGSKNTKVIGRQNLPKGQRAEITREQKGGDRLLGQTVITHRRKRKRSGLNSSMSY